MPLNIFTFQRYEKEENIRKAKQKHKKQVLYIGGDKRFKYPEEKKDFDSGPSPDKYNLHIKWGEKKITTKKELFL